ncbi:MAG: hypothetical protein WB297_02655 [Actinomycetota bacterium]
MEQLGAGSGAEGRPGVDVVGARGHLDASMAYYILVHRTLLEAEKQVRRS